MNNKHKAFEKFWDTQIVSSVTGSVDTALWGYIDRNDSAFIFTAGYDACKKEYDIECEKLRAQLLKYSEQAIADGEQRLKDMEVIRSFMKAK